MVYKKCEEALTSMLISPQNLHQIPELTNLIITAQHALDKPEAVAREELEKVNVQLEYYLALNKLLAAILAAKNTDHAGVAKDAEKNVLIPSMELFAQLKEGKKLEQLPILTEAILRATDVVNNPSKENKDAFKQAIKNAPGHSKAWRKWLGGGMIFAGAIVVTLGLISALATGGLSLGAIGIGLVAAKYLAIGGGATAVSGYLVEHSGAKKGYAEKLTTFSEKVPTEVAPVDSEEKEAVSLLSPGKKRR